MPLDHLLTKPLAKCRHYPKTRVLRRFGTTTLVLAIPAWVFPAVDIDGTGRSRQPPARVTRPGDFTG